MFFIIYLQSNLNYENTLFFMIIFQNIFHEKKILFGLDWDSNIDHLESLPGLQTIRPPFDMPTIEKT